VIFDSAPQLLRISARLPALVDTGFGEALSTNPAYAHTHVHLSEAWPDCKKKVSSGQVGEARRCQAMADRDAGPYAYFPGTGGLPLVEPNGTAGLPGFLDCFGFFFSLLLRS